MLGQSAAIYGVFNWSTLGLITLSFTLDGSPLSKTFQVTSTTTQFQSQLGQQPNFQFFSYDFLPPGNHTLVVNVTDCINQTFSFDYISFQPSFSTLAAMPNLTSLTGTEASHSGSSHLSAGAVAGIVIAVIVIIGCVYLARRIRKKRPDDNLGKPCILTLPSLNSTRGPFTVRVNPFHPTRRRDSGTIPLNIRSVSSASGSMRTVSNDYTPVHVLDPDASGRPSTALGPTSQTGFVDREYDTMGDELSPPSYDESNRMNSVTIVR